MQALKDFIERVRPLPRLVIQAHDFPDHDAVSSSFAFAELLAHFGVKTTLVYNGLIDRISLQNMIDWLEIPIRPWREAGLTEADKIITIDGCIGEKNVLDLPGEEIAVIDHHQVRPPPSLWYQDVRPDYGACASILHEYYGALGVPMPPKVATALQVGLAIDTANLTRGFQQADVRAFAHFHEIADQTLIHQICRNSLLRSEVVFYRQLLESLKVQDGIAFAWMAEGCPKNMLGMMGDFLMAVHEIDTTILAAPAGEVIQLSLRSEHPQVNVGRVVKELLAEQRIGFGGGHAHMAGGIVQRASFDVPNPAEQLFALFLHKLPR